MGLKLSFIQKQRQLVNTLIVCSLTFLIMGCGPSLKGLVVMPDGSPMEKKGVVVYTNPWTDSVKVKEDGTFSIGKNIELTKSYTLIAEDTDGNMGFVKGYQPGKETNKKIVIKLSKELEAKDAVIEGDLYINPDSGPGEKILKSSQ